MDRSNYRIEKDGNGIVNGVEGTIYRAYEFDAGQHAFIFAGRDVAPGFDRTPAQCLDHWLNRED